MLTFSKFLKALTDNPNPAEKLISQRKLAEYLHISPSVVNEWVNNDKLPRMEADYIAEGIDQYRLEHKPKKNLAEFVERIINNMDIEPAEASELKKRYEHFKKENSSASDPDKLFLAMLIQMAMDKVGIENQLEYSAFDQRRAIVAIGHNHLVAVKEDGRVLACGKDDFGQCSVRAWRDIVSVAAGWEMTLGLKKDGTCIGAGRNIIGNGEIFAWKDIVSISGTNQHFLALKSDGTVLAYAHGAVGDGRCDVSGWRDIKAVATGVNHSVGLREDGTVVACGSNKEGQCEVSSWKNVVQVAASLDRTVGLTEDGEILLAGDRHIYDFSGWKDVISVATGFFHIAGLKKDGTVLHTGHETDGQDSVWKWWDICAIYAAGNTTVGIRSDGTVLRTTSKYAPVFYNTSGWNVFDEVKQKNSKNAGVPAVIKELIVLFQEIHDIGRRMYTEVHNSHERSDLLLQMRERCKKTMEIKAENEHIKPLSNIILGFNTSFCLLLETYTKDEQTGIFIPSEISWKRYNVFLLDAKTYLRMLREI